MPSHQPSIDRLDGTHGMDCCICWYQQRREGVDNGDREDDDDDDDDADGDMLAC